MNRITRAALWGASSLYSRSSHTPRENGSMIWDFNEIVPSADLNWTPCFDNFTCSRLQVPLDYADPSAGNTAIAFIKHPAPNATAETRDILYNPGGPGDTGVGELFALIDDLRFILGDAHNIVGFDPRGVNNSGPSIDCFPGDQTNEDTFAATYIPVVDAESPQSVAQLWALGGAYGDWCSAAHMNDSARYVSTSAVAQDMLRYVDVSHNYSDGKLWYYGVSYGTVLGGTFASLHPDRIGRMILDGVVELEDWYAGNLKANVLDDDKIVEQFFQYCYRAGSEKCAFYAASPREIEQRLRNLVEAIRREPIGVSDQRKVTRPIIITYEVMRFAILNALYRPQEQWPGFAKQLLDLENRNGSSMARLAQLFHGPFIGSTVFCSDAGGRYNLSTPELFTEHVETMKLQSYWAGESWLHPVECRQMHLTPPPSQQFDFHTTKTNGTVFPILFVSNTLDPVTPLVGARKMQAHFSGSALLVQDAMGHGSSSAPSNCTARYVQDYLAGRSLPPGTTCQPNMQPFDD